MPTEQQQKLIGLYQQMSELTAPECRAVCRVPHSCCAVEHCESVAWWAKKAWNIELQKTNHPTLPFMGSTGCTVPPHLRPTCTIHTCEINGAGCKRDDPEWTKKYFKLREEIEIIELDLFIVELETM